ncbi:N-acetyltransferase GCN5 [Liquorilactobacillus cacaonum DSM 21116]|uniref:N-acetyltransferase GCN5 n=1 Tax=Liquorilactobacillus cacaonum DSM 21116 TaxID=1423729 RepID=A0A0R2CRP5_9LACO|nr:N-acetyltransferase GCN5 [Liquorilactobacillus cacaonum DSM 21116]
MNRSILKGAFDLQIRKATKKDAPAIVSLFNIIVDEMMLETIKRIDRSKLNIVIQNSFETPEFLGKWSQTYVATKNNLVVGFLYGYPAENEEKMNDLMHSFLKIAGLDSSLKIFTDLETLPNEWYLNSIVVDPTYQNQGIGSELLALTNSIVKDQNIEKMGLNVDWENPRAEKLYKSLGFEKVGFKILGNHNYNHLQRKIQ